MAGYLDIAIPPALSPRQHLCCHCPEKFCTHSLHTHVYSQDPKTAGADTSEDNAMPKKGKVHRDREEHNYKESKSEWDSRFHAVGFMQ